MLGDIQGGLPLFVHAAFPAFAHSMTCLLTVRPGRDTVLALVRNEFAGHRRQDLTGTRSGPAAGMISLHAAGCLPFLPRTARHAD